MLPYPISTPICQFLCKKCWVGHWSHHHTVQPLVYILLLRTVHSIMSFLIAMVADDIHLQTQRSFLSGSLLLLGWLNPRCLWMSSTCPCLWHRGILTWYRSSQLWWLWRPWGPCWSCSGFTQGFSLSLYWMHPMLWYLMSILKPLLVQWPKKPFQCFKSLT